MTFEDLTFHEPNEHNYNRQAKVFFPNSYGASVVIGDTTYGGSAGLYELAVLRGDTENWKLCYSTPITSDVEGYLTPAEVTALLQRIEELEAA